MNEVTHGYAVSELAGLIPISGISRESRHDFGQLSCPGCGREMIASLGTIVAHHFKHKHTEDVDSCSFETYLHKMSKTLLADTLRQDLAAGRKLVVSVPENRVDIRVVRGRAVGEVAYAFESAAVSEVLSTAVGIEIEKGFKGPIADVLVSYADEDPVFFEIFKTHKCNEDKLSKGLKIIEFEIKTEQDAERMRDVVRSGLITPIAGFVEIYGFGSPQLLVAYEPASVESTFGVYEQALAEEQDVQAALRREVHGVSTQLSRSRAKIAEIEAEPKGFANAFINQIGLVFVGDLEPPLPEGRSLKAEEAWRPWTAFSFPKPRMSGDNHLYDAAVRSAERLWPGRVRSCLLCKNHVFTTTGKPMACPKRPDGMYQGQAGLCGDYQKLGESALRKHRAELLVRAPTPSEAFSIPV